MARLFEQGGDVIPELDKRVAWGKVGEPTQNSSWAKILTWLESALGFLKKDANLSDLTNKATARENLGVYSTGQVNTKIGDRALKDNVLGLDNTTPYTPTSSYHPATRKMVLDLLKAGPAYASMVIDPAFESVEGISVHLVRVQQWGRVVAINGRFNGRLPSDGSDKKMFTLPSGFKPPEYGFNFGVSSTNGTGGLLSMRTDGTIRSLFRENTTSYQYFFSFTYISEETY